MQSIVILAAFLLVAGVSAEQPQEVSNVQTGGPSQPSHVIGHTSSVESTGPQAGFAGPHQQHFASGQVGFEQPGAPQYYSPTGLVQVVGQQGELPSQQSPTKPGAVQTIKHYAAAGPEQYGQPESASIPPNYKPFGSWGLYIGGNPADGYYSNYYKALSNSVSDKQQAAVTGETAKPTGPQSFVGQASGFGPSTSFYKQQGPVYGPQAAAFQDQTYQGYPYGEYYTPADLNSGSRVQVQNQQPSPAAYQTPSVYSSAFAPTEYQPTQQPGAAMYYAAETYATKKGGPQFAQKEVQAPLSPAKGYQQQQQQQQQRFGYGYATQTAYQSPVAVHQASGYQPQPQVVAYPVPVGSQLVGSQPGVEGAFQPYGVHGFTRYAVKPTVVNAEQTYYHTGVHSAPAGQFPVYKQQFAGYQQPLSFYGYPLSQLHYSTGAVAPAFGAQGPSASGPAPTGPSPASQGSFSAAVPQPGAPQPGAEQSGPVVHAPGFPVEAASSEKSETNSADKQADKPQPQKRA